MNNQVKLELNREQVVEFLKTARADLTEDDWKDADVITVLQWALPTYQKWTNYGTWNDTPPVPTIKPGDKVTHVERGCQKDIVMDSNIKYAPPESKEFPDIEELKKQLAAAQEELARINCDYYADKQRFVVQRRELEESKDREKKLREAIFLEMFWHPFIQRRKPNRKC